MNPDVTSPTPGMDAADVSLDHDRAAAEQALEIAERNPILSGEQACAVAHVHALLAIEQRLAQLFAAGSLLRAAQAITLLPMLLWRCSREQFSCDVRPRGARPRVASRGAWSVAGSTRTTQRSRVPMGPGLTYQARPLRGASRSSRPAFPSWISPVSWRCSSSAICRPSRAPFHSLALTTLYSSKNIP